MRSKVLCAASLAALLCLARPADAADLVVLKDTSTTGGFKPPPPCRPMLDVRSLVRIEREEGEATVCQRNTLYTLTLELCSREQSAVQIMASRLLDHVTVFLPLDCAGDSLFTPLGSRIVFSEPQDDRREILIHEFTHALYWDLAGRHHAVEWVPCLVDEILTHTGFHDYSTRDRDDQTETLLMDAHTSQMSALNEGLGNAVAMAHSKGKDRMSTLTAQFRLESQARGRDERGGAMNLWRQKTWDQQQGNEWFVGAVLHDYLTRDGRTPAQVRPRLLRLIAALRASRPARLQDLLWALMSPDPTELDRILASLNSNWDSNREELRRLGQR